MSIFRQFLRPPAGSVNVAKDRLRLVLVHNRLEMPADVVNKLRKDMLAVLARYFDVDQDTFVLDVQRGVHSSQLVTTVGLKSKQTKRQK